MTKVKTSQTTHKHTTENIMVNIATSTDAPATASIAKPKDCQPNLDATFEAALEHARRLTTMFGTGSAETAIAWETVEELRSAKARNARLSNTPRAAFLRYCEQNPDALEARIYDN